MARAGRAKDFAAQWCVHLSAHSRGKRRRSACIRRLDSHFQGATRGHRSHEAARRIRDELRVPAADANDHGAGDAFHARLRRDRSRLSHHQPGRADHALSRRLRQLVQPDRGPGGRDAAFRRWRGARQRPARSGACLCLAAHRGEFAGGDAGLPARQPLLRDRPAVGHRVEAVRDDDAGLAARAGDLRFRASSHRLRL